MAGIDSIDEIALQSTPTGTRTPVPWLRTKYPRPLDDGGQKMQLMINQASSQSSNQRRGDDILGPIHVATLDLTS